MGRPAASPQNKAFSVMFSKMITTKTDSPHDVVARIGPYSLYAIFSKACPHVCRKEDTPRDGVSELEFNKVLQAAGFNRIRNRKCSAVNKQRDPLGAGHYLFGYCRYLDPSVPAERATIISRYSAIAKQANSMFQQTSIDDVLDLVTSVLRGWSLKDHQSPLNACKYYPEKAEKIQDAECERFDFERIPSRCSSAASLELTDADDCAWSHHHEAHSDLVQSHPAVRPADREVAQCSSHRTYAASLQQPSWLESFLDDLESTQACLGDANSSAALALFEADDALDAALPKCEEAWDSACAAGGPASWGSVQRSTSAAFMQSRLFGAFVA